MCTPPSSRNAPPARKYFGSRVSCAASSSAEYGSVRTGGFFPGKREAIASMTTARNAAYVKNSSDERCWVYTRLAEAGLEEVDGQRPGEVDHDQNHEDDPGSGERRPVVTHVL